MSLRITILGCGSSGGVPRVGAMWGKCDPTNPKNRRRRCSILIERKGKHGTTTVLVDTSPDLREQLLSVRCEAIDGVLFTHDHADHTHGIDDLRMVAYAMKARIPCHFDQETRDSLTTRFAYCFDKKGQSAYPPILSAHTLQPGTPMSIDGAGGEIPVLPVRQAHGDIASLGFRFGSIAYSPDVSDLSAEAAAQLQGAGIWIVDALRYTPHPSHFSLKQALGWIERLSVERAILTHMTADLDYDALRRELPSHIEPAFDGMVVET